ncbi:MAG: XRE family transcriptional regulator [Bacillota bacterium]
MQIGEKIKRLRMRLNLTQEELASRTELSKGFISQLERDLTSPSIATLMDILEALGTNVSDFFAETPMEKVVFGEEDMFIKDDAQGGYSIRWLVTSAQKNALEPILVTIQPGGRTYEDDPHMGEEFGYVLLGGITLVHGTHRYKVKRGGSFYFKPTSMHYLINSGKSEARVLWVSTPPSF